MLDPAAQREYESLTAGCGFADLPRTLIEARGNDRTSFLNSFCTNDVKRLAVGQGCEAFVTSHQGKTLGHVFIYYEPERLMIDTVGEQAEKLIAHFDRFVISEDVQFQDVSSEMKTLLVAGAKSAEVLRSVTGVTAPSAIGDWIDAPIAGDGVAIRRVEYAGEFTFFLQAAVGQMAAIQAALVAAGAEACSEAAVESARLEAGFPLFGRDISDENLPQEVGRDAQAISFKKGCYLGQETVARLDALGHVNRRLVGVRFDGESVPPADSSLMAGDKAAGRVTSAAWSPRLNGPLALALVRQAHAAVGTKLAWDAGLAEVVSLPLAG